MSGSRSTSVRVAGPRSASSGALSHRSCQDGRGNERGQITLFGVGMVVVLLLVFGLAIDLWRVAAERRTLAEIADSAAVAGANGVDVDRYRLDGLLVLDPLVAKELAWSSLEGQSALLDSAEVRSMLVEPDRIEIVLVAQVELTLLDLLSPSEPLEIMVLAEAQPRRGALDAVP